MSVMRALVATSIVAAIAALAAAPANAGTYYIWDDWGGTWSDAEKTGDNPDDDLLCWAGAASNILEWTGWGQVGGMTTTDEMFAHFQAHFTDDPGNPYVAWDWWFDGTNDQQGVSGWAQEDVDGGGGFYPTETYTDYAKRQTVGVQAMSTIDAYLRDGYGTTIWIGGEGAHVITVWGVETTAAGQWKGLWVTDSDDSRFGVAPRPDILQYYDVALSGQKWYLKGYGSGSWHIGDVQGLLLNPNRPVVPEPLTLGLVACGLAALAASRRR